MDVHKNAGLTPSSKSRSTGVALTRSRQRLACYFCAYESCGLHQEASHNETGNSGLPGC
jgi:hypothetical protein